MDKAVARIRQALVSGETMVVYGDFDAGRHLRNRHPGGGTGPSGRKMLAYLPHRVQEGYGLNTDSLDNLQTQGRLSGHHGGLRITNNAEVAYAQAHGLDVIITDHHNGHVRPAPGAGDRQTLRTGLFLSV